MKLLNVTLVPLTDDDREQFIIENQWAFKHGAMIEFGERDNSLDGDGEIISRKTIERCIDAPDSETYRIVADGRRVGGVILKINKETRHNELEILFVSPRSTEGESALALGRRWRHCTPRPRYGRPARLILKSEISIFTSISAALRLTSSGASIFSLTTSFPTKGSRVATRALTKCSAL